ncbi:MAG: FAD-binding oxidoreductase, partial [Proteobacteria bacterium]|nr:FAD-binding oxidoreductase [Pseudomonadota bacterium]
MEVQGWGRFPTASAEVLEPIDADSLKKMVSANKKTGSMIPRGAGRSYGDSSLADQLISSRFLDSFLSIDENKLSLRCGAGVSLDQILKLCIPRGWFLPVLPGTKFVSVGGAIAADIHGKNHHLDGSFCDHVLSLSLMLASGEVLVCSRDFNSDLFHATCGGMGLTGMIVDATVKLDKVSGVFIKRQLLIANNLQHCFEVLENNHDSKYSVAWLDCLASGEELGRSVVYLGEHADKGEPRYQSRGGANIPFSTPAFLLNKITMRIFNSTYFKLKQKGQQESDVNYDTYFFPLDNIGHWNRLYGSKGFLQYQFVIPEESTFAAINMILSK